MPDRDEIREQVLYIMKHYREMKDRLAYLEQRMAIKETAGLVEAAEEPKSDNVQLKTVSGYQKQIRRLRADKRREWEAEKAALEGQLDFFEECLHRIGEEKSKVIRTLSVDGVTWGAAEWGLGKSKAQLCSLRREGVEELTDLYMEYGSDH